MACIQLGEIGVNIIPIVTGCLFAFLNRLLLIIDGIMLPTHPLILTLFLGVAGLFSIFPLIILKHRTKSLKNLSSDELNSFIINELKLSRDVIKKQITKGKWKYIILSSTSTAAEVALLTITLKVKTNLYIWNILSTSIFCKYFLKLKLYRHHYLSIVIIILTGIIGDIISENIQSDISNNLLLFFIRIIREILYSTHEIVSKYLMEDKFCSVYELSIYSAICIIIFMGIISIFEPYLHLDNFQEYFDNFDIKELLAIFGIVIFHYGYILSTLFTNKNNTPCHTFIIIVFGQLVNSINFTSTSIPIVICLVFVLFISLIFNEIIEINCFGLSKNTRRNIVDRAENEDLIIKKIPSLESIEDKGYLIEFKEKEECESTKSKN